MYAAFGVQLINSASWDRPSRPHPWVALLTGLDDKFGYRREFKRCVYDRSRAAKSGRWTYAYYFLPPGLYEICYPSSWKHNERYFAKVDENGDIHKITKDDVLCHLKNNTSE